MATKLEIVSIENPPVTVDEARKFCRLFDDSHDPVLRLLIDAAIEFLEGQLREQLRVRTWRMTSTAGEITAGMILPKWPVIELSSFSVAGNSQSMTGLSFDQPQWPAKLTGSYAASGDQVLTWKAGPIGGISASRKLLILQVVADYHRQREASGGERDLSIGTKLLLEGENQHIDAVRG